MSKSSEQMGEMRENKEGEPKKRIVSIEGGGDWADASYDLLEVPLDLDLAKEKSAYNRWLAEEYYPARNSSQEIDFKTFPEWLKGRGAKDYSEIEIFRED